MPGQPGQQRPPQKPEKGQRIAALNEVIVIGQEAQELMNSAGWKREEAGIQKEMTEINDAWWKMDIDKMPDKEVLRALYHQRPQMRTLAKRVTSPAAKVFAAEQAGKELKLIKDHGGDITGKKEEEKKK